MAIGTICRESKIWNKNRCRLNLIENDLKIRGDPGRFLYRYPTQFRPERPLGIQYHRTNSLWLSGEILLSCFGPAWWDLVASFATGDSTTVRSLGPKVTFIVTALSVFWDQARFRAHITGSSIAGLCPRFLACPAEMDVITRGCRQSRNS